MSHRQQMIHPFTFFLVNDVQLAYDNAYKGDASDSIKALHLLTLSLDEKGQEALKKEIAEMETILDGRKPLNTTLFRHLYAKVSIHSVRSVIASQDTQDTNIDDDASDAINATSKTLCAPLSVQEVLEKVRSAFVQGTDAEWIGLAVESGLSKEDAEKLFESLKGQELFCCDMEQGLWRWVRE